MSYSITVKKVTREMVTKNEYVGKGALGADESGYRDASEERDIEREVYSQIVEDLKLTDVIDAVNGKDKASGNV